MFNIELRPYRDSFALFADGVWVGPWIGRNYDDRGHTTLELMQDDGRGHLVTVRGSIRNIAAKASKIINEAAVAGRLCWHC